LQPIINTISKSIDKQIINVSFTPAEKKNKTASFFIFAAYYRPEIIKE
jgi:hypothetical protein